MKFRKTVALLICCTIMIDCTACGTSNEKEDYSISEAGTWKDGTYTASAKGKYGTFDVEVIIKNGYIEDIIVGENSETPEKGGKAIEQIVDTVIGSQTLEVDAVSGATITSDGLKEAISECLSDASATEESSDETN